MNTKRALSGLICVVFLACFAKAYAETDYSVNMVIDDSNIVREIYPEMYGVNMEWSVGNGKIWSLDRQGNLVMNESFPKAYGELLQFTRKAGTSANYFKWKDALGKVEDRKTQKIWNVSNKVYEGVIEWLTELYAGCENPRITYTVNVFTDDMENLADIVEFLIGDGSINYNGGENWAEVRKSLGIKNPVDIYTWEIGNELDWEDDKWSAEQYTEVAEKAIDIIRSIDPDAKICMHTSTNYWNGSDYSQNWHRTFLKKLGDRIDYISVHYYYPAGFIMRADAPIERLKQDIVEITGSDRIKLYYSEHAPARNVSTFTKTDNYEYCMPHTIWGATGQAEFYLRKWLDPWVVASTCHSVDSANWSISYTDADGITKMTATGEIMQTFKKYGVGNLLDSNLDSFSTTESSPIAGGIIEDNAGNVNVLFANRNETANVTVNFEFKDNLYKVKHIRKVHGAVKNADNWYRAGDQWAYDNPNRVEITDEDIENEEYLSKYTFEPLSLYALQLEKIDDSERTKIIDFAFNNCVAFGGDCPLVLDFGGIKGASEVGNPEIADGVTYIPLSMLKTIIKEGIETEQTESTVSLNFQGHNIVFNLADNTVNAENIPSAKVLDGEVFIPLRSVLKTFGYGVSWDKRNFVIIYKSGDILLPNSTLLHDRVYQTLIGG